MMMHKAEKKYEVGKVADEEEAKQRQLRAILNKLTYQNFEKLVDQVKSVNIDNRVTLYGVSWQIFNRALTEPIFCEMYADLSYHLSYELPEFPEDDSKINFKRVLINLCQEQFEREKEEEEANKTDEQGGKKQSKQRKLGNIRFIGELCKKKFLAMRIIQEVMKELLDHDQFPDEEDLEGLCILMSTVGEMIDNLPKGKGFLDNYFDRIVKLSKDMNLSSRIRFMLEDVIDLRKNKWQPRRRGQNI